MRGMSTRESKTCFLIPLLLEIIHASGMPNIREMAVEMSAISNDVASADSTCGSNIIPPLCVSTNIAGKNTKRMKNRADTMYSKFPNRWFF